MNTKLKFYRGEVGLSQYELAEASGVPRYKIQLAEQGMACLSRNEAIRILRFLGLDKADVPNWINKVIDQRKPTNH